MLIDVVFMLLMALALFKGFRRGFIVAIFSLFAIIIGLAAALKLSAVVAGFLQENMQVSGKWLAVLSFVLVFAGIVLLVQWAAILLKKSAGILLLGWLDTLGGILLYAVMYIMIYSVVLFYAMQVQLISPATADQSNTYAFVKPWGPWTINGIGKVIPVFSNLFAQLSQFFGGVSQSVS